MDSVLVRFGRRVRELRKAKGMSQEALALEAGLDRSYVGGVERGERNISLHNIGRLAQAHAVRQFVNPQPTIIGSVSAPEHFGRVAQAMTAARKVFAIWR